MFVQPIWGRRDSGIMVALFFKVALLAAGPPTGDERPPPLFSSALNPLILLVDLDPCWFPYLLELIISFLKQYCSSLSLLLWLSQLLESTVVATFRVVDVVISTLRKISDPLCRRDLLCCRCSYLNASKNNMIPYLSSSMSYCCHPHCRPVAIVISMTKSGCSGRKKGEKELH
jgi:hypothetical protein